MAARQLRILALGLLVALGAGVGRVYAQGSTVPSGVLPGAAPIVDGIELDLPEGEDPHGVLALMALEIGKPRSRPAIRRASERLFATGRYGAIEIRERDGAPGHITLMVRASLRTVADKVLFKGEGRLSDDDVKRAAGVGETRVEYYPELLDKAKDRIQKACALIGYPDAAVHADITTPAGQGRVLTFWVALGSPTRIAESVIVGDPGLSEAEVRELLGMNPGEIRDGDRMAKGIRALRERLIEERFYRARVGVPESVPTEGGASVHLPINAGPRITFLFKGNRELSEGELRQALAYEGKEPLDEAQLAELADRLSDYYRRIGFEDAHVVARTLRRPGGGGGGVGTAEQFVLFSVQEGGPIRVRQVTFAGNSVFSSTELRADLEDALAEAVPVAWSEASVRPEPGTLYYEPAYRKAIVRMLDRYRSAGYLGALITPPELERDVASGVAEVRFQVREGERTFIREIVIEGGDEAVAAAATLPIRVDQPFDFAAIDAARSLLEQRLSAKGYLFARVKEREEFDPVDRTRAKVYLSAQTGPRVKVGRVLIQGNTETVAGTIRSALAFKEGDWLDAEQIIQSQQNLVKLGIFRSATIQMSAPDLPEEVKDLFVSVDERNTRVITGGVGYSLIDGPRVFGEFTKYNLFGRALEFQARAKFNYFNWSSPALEAPSSYARSGLDALGREINLSLKYPRIIAFLPTEVGAHLDLIHERINRPSYGFTRTAAILGSDFSLAENLLGSLQYEIESDQLDKSRVVQNVVLTPADIERLRFDEGTVDLHSIRGTLGYDLRDNAIDPHRGVWLGTTLEVVQSLGGKIQVPGETGTQTPFSLFLKASGQVNAYFPLPGQVVLGLSLRGGRIFPLDGENRSQTIPPKRFFLGGATSLRGFLDDSVVPEDTRRQLHGEVAQCAADPSQCSAAAKVLKAGTLYPSDGGEAFALIRSELRFPLTGSLQGAIFLDAGNLWADPEAMFGQFRLRMTSGVGLRIVTPIGPAAFDLGFNLAPDRVLNESLIVPHFSIGFF